MLATLRAHTCSRKGRQVSIVGIVGPATVHKEAISIQSLSTSLEWLLSIPMMDKVWRIAD